ncbi:MAG: Trigger factor [Chroococcidiopsis cubana SAG 39.79]|jgi:trigger factor|uniref:Trigger factor n=2 Tax=Chroococcidiopsis TaxID=54298 RepID=K9TY67_CHRTP|nr:MULTISPECIES: trigger factor [Chroococcidiopsis]MBE9018844.1 trigger factor [Chroococcidiopsidales cyanobacterium LEGE 13417]PSB44147.1 trigger factor [Cyanosarcina cf. burmensis CCALA 770]AFY87318.1 trigger factor [Chroococcidiopsis thermalis PCC 7203]MDZ4874678.1 Trigger factor [Chroococcidiopsis cubana SAG 39.79]PSB63753.1 trigger factor [Chroococcidiopsis cubana CCALA 043]
MKVTQEKLPASQIGLEIEIPADKSQQSYEQVIQNFTRAANIPGFRKGKVPRQILLQRLGTTRIKAAALEELIQSGITEAIKQAEIEAIGQPQLRSSFEDLIGAFEPGKPLTFSAAVDVLPEIELKQYSGLQVKAEEVKYDPEKVEKVLEENRQERATLIPVEGRAAQMGDVVIIDFKGYLVPEAEGEEPQEIEGASATDFETELSPGRFIEGFVDGIVGMSPGETKEISAQFPEGYPQQEIAGKPAKFTVTVKELKEKELPELNDDFAQEISEFETLAELRSTLETRFREEAEKKTKTNKQQALLDDLIEHLEADLPETMIEQEVDSVLTQTAMQLQRQGIDVKKLFTKDTVPQLRQRSRPEAIDRLKRSLALQEVAKKESIEVEPAAVEARVKELMAEYSGQDIDRDRLKEVVQEELLTDKIFVWLEEHSAIELVPEGSLQDDEEDEIDDAEIIEESTQPEASEATITVEATEAE